DNEYGAVPMEVAAHRQSSSHDQKPITVAIAVQHCISLDVTDFGSGKGSEINGVADVLLQRGRFVNVQSQPGRRTHGVTKIVEDVDDRWSVSLTDVMIRAW